jgi:transposase-like protein
VRINAGAVRLKREEALRPRAQQNRRHSLALTRGWLVKEWQVEGERLKQFEREVFELRRANEILRKASAFFGQAELDRRPK